MSFKNQRILYFVFYFKSLEMVEWLFLFSILFSSPVFGDSKVGNSETNFIRMNQKLGEELVSVVSESPSRDEVKINPELANKIKEHFAQIHIRLSDISKKLPQLLKHVPQVLLDAGINDVYGIQLNELLKDFDSLKLTPIFDRFAVISVNKSVNRSGSICNSDNGQIIVNMLTFTSVLDDETKISELLLHEGLCSSYFNKWIIFKSRKYDDSHYQISSKMLVLYYFIKMNRIDLAKKINNDWKSKPESVSPTILADGGGITGGPSGGNFTAIRFLSQFLLKFEIIRDSCEASNSVISLSSIKGETINVPCKWFKNSYLIQLFYNSKAEEPSFTNIIQDSPEWVNLATSVNYRVLNSPIEHKLELVFDVGPLYSFTVNDQFIEDMFYQLFKPCTQSTSTSSCFFDETQFFGANN